MEEAAERLGIPISTLLRLVRETTIWPAEKPDGTRGIRESEVRRFIAG
jgi:excisionase family DNA binding protein